MPNPSRAKGDRFERDVVSRHIAAGIEAVKVPLSGAVEGFKGDVIVGRDGYRGECKSRKNGEGFAVIEGWLKGNDLLFMKRDRAEPLVVMTFEMYIRLMAGR
jgi:Holliday junction resolvase